jgi:transcriptional regulator with XRE-family HTH domain
MPEQPHFGRRLRKLRQARGLSQAAVAGDGMSTGYLSRLESGERRATERVVAYLAQQLGVAPAAFARSVNSLSEVLAATASAPEIREDTEALTRAIAEDEGDDLAARWQALWRLSCIHHRDGDHHAELTPLSELVELSDILKTPELRTRAQVQYARCLRALGDMQAARTAATEALDIARDRQLSAADTTAALMVLISVEVESGAMDAAVEHVAELESQIQDGIAPAQAAEALWTAAMVRVRQGDQVAAMSLLERALNQLDSKDDLRLWARLRAAATAAAFQMTPPHLDAARRWLAEAETALSLIGVPLQVQELRSLQAHLAFYEGRLDDARRLCDEVLGGKPGLSYRDHVRLSVLAGRLMILDGRTVEGIAALLELGQQAGDSKNLDLAAQIWQSLATALAEIRERSDGAS